MDNLYDEIDQALANVYAGESEFDRIAAMGVEALPAVLSLTQLFRSMSQRDNAGSVLTRMGSIAVEPMISLIRNGKMSLVDCLDLADIKDPRVFPFLMELLNSDDEEKQQWSAFAIGKLREPEAVPRLIELLKSKNEDVRTYSVSALRKIGDFRAIVPFEQLLKSGRATSLEKMHLIPAIKEIKERCSK